MGFIGQLPKASSVGLVSLLSSMNATAPAVGEIPAAGRACSDHMDQSHSGRVGEFRDLMQVESLPRKLAARIQPQRVTMTEMTTAGPVKLGPNRNVCVWLGRCRYRTLKGKLKLLDGDCGAPQEDRCLATVPAR